MKITIISPLGKYESAEHEDDSFTLSSVIASLGKSIAKQETLTLVTGPDSFIQVPFSVVAQSVIEVHGCLIDPPPAAKPNLAVVE